MIHASSVMLLTTLTRTQSATCTLSAGETMQQYEALSCWSPLRAAYDMNVWLVMHAVCTLTDRCVNIKHVVVNQMLGFQQQLQT